MDLQRAPIGARRSGIVDPRDPPAAADDVQHPRARRRRTRTSIAAPRGRLLAASDLTARGRRGRRAGELRRLRVRAAGHVVDAQEQLAGAACLRRPDEPAQRRRPAPGASRPPAARMPTPEPSTTTSPRRSPCSTARSVANSAAPALPTNSLREREIWK